MQKASIYIVQIVGILVLLCGYLLSDQPDSLSEMHFNPDPACPSVFLKATKSVDNASSLQISSSSQNNPFRKTNVPKFVSYEVILPCKDETKLNIPANIEYAFPLPENYAYLFFEEINPPPPKAC